MSSTKSWRRTDAPTSAFRSKRFDRKIYRALAIASALFACGTPPAAEPEDPEAASWTKSPPAGCAIGLSGPTLNPGDALRYARRNALTRLATGDANTTVHVESELLVSSAGQRGGEFTRQDLSGAVRDAKIVAMWAEGATDPHTRTRTRHVYALACDRGASAARLTDPTVPAWLLNVPDDGTRACAIGIGGPTRNPNDQPEATLRDVRRALAATLESKLEAIIIDTGRHRPVVSAQLESSARARERAERVSELEAVWTDEDGHGPLGLKQAQYGLACLPL